MVHRVPGVASVTGNIMYRRVAKIVPNGSGNVCTISRTRRVGHRARQPAIDAGSPHHWKFRGTPAIRAKLRSRTSSGRVSRVRRRYWRIDFSRHPLIWHTMLATDANRPCISIFTRPGSNPGSRSLILQYKYIYRFMFYIFYRFLFYFFSLQKNFNL
jgi:hypothetical protein